MICYMDQTFCSFWRDCKDGEGCPRALTQFVKEGAKKWWPSNAPICQYGEKPDCHKLVEDDS